MTQIEDDWLWGWDRTPGIVSVYAEADGRALVWRRDPVSGVLHREEEMFRPLVLLASLVDLQHLGARLRPEGNAPSPGGVSYRELEGTGGLRYLVRAEDGRALSRAVLQGARSRLGRPVSHLRELGAESVLALPPEEQYLVATGRTYFKSLSFAAVRRLQFDLETTGLDPESSRIFLVALRDPDGKEETLEVAGEGDNAEAELLMQLCERIRELDPDVIENHNLHGFDLPFLVQRARRLGVTLLLARNGEPGLQRRPASRGAALAQGAEQQRADAMRRSRYTMPGRELIDSLDAVRRHDFSARDLPGHGLKAVARHLGLASEDREYIRYFSTIRSACGATRKTTSAKPRVWRACWVVQRSRSPKWYRAATSAWPTRARRLACSIRCSCAPICARMPPSPLTNPATVRSTKARPCT